MRDLLQMLFGLPVPGKLFKRSVCYQATIDLGRAEEAKFLETYVPPTEPKPYVLRMHEATLDPAFPAKREAAARKIISAMKAVLTPAGFVQKGQTFVRDIGRCKCTVRLHRDRRGFEAMMELTVQGPRTPLSAAQSKTVQLSSFPRPDEYPDRGDGNTGWIEYWQVHLDPSCITPHTHLLQARALPWLLAHESAGSPDVSQYRGQS